MKILKLTFKNINSLLGENEIDFTQSVFTNDGLFAITGKTGAGKSSILDAISLALYGKTPRVEITGSENAVMTQGQRDCYSEIVFEAGGKQWKSTWKQELNRNGKLKPVSRVIADTNNQIIADQVRSCDAKIIEIIGLTFEQFTKVILLAQGSFAAFLQADKNDKGELLEQITGTEIYAEISKKVFEKHRYEREKLNLISLELQAIKVFPEEEIQKLTKELSELEEKRNQLEKNRKELELAQKWLENLRNLQSQIRQIKLKMPELDEKTKNAAIYFEKIEAEWKNLKDKQSQQEPIFKKVRELDTQISEKEKNLQPILKNISELETNKDVLSKKLEEKISYLEEIKTLFFQKQSWITKNQKYEQLTADFTALKNENEQLISTENDLKKEHNDLIELQKDLNTKKNKTQNTSLLLDKKNRQLTAKNQELETLKNEFSTLLNGRKINELQTEKEKISNFGQQIKNWIEVETTISRQQREISDFEDRILNFKTTEKELYNEIILSKEKQKQLESHLSLLDEAIELTRRIQSLEEHRKHLKDGESCPLCGALEHPFAQGNIPQMGKKQTERTFLKEKHEKITNEILQNEKKLAKLVSDRDNILENKAKETFLLQENYSKQKEITSEIENTDPNFSFPKEKDVIKALNAILEQKRDAFKQINTQIERADTLEKQIANLRDTEIITLQREKEGIETEKSEFEIQQKLAEHSFLEKQKTVEDTQRKYEVQKNSFLHKINQYEAENIEKLHEKLTFWNENRKKIDELASQIVELKNEIALNNKELDTKNQLLSDKKAEKSTIEAEKSQLWSVRYEIFSEKSVEVEENKLKESVETHEKSKIEAEKIKNDTFTALKNQNAILTDKEKEFLDIQKQQITNKTDDELQKEIDENKQQSDNFSQKIGANRQILNLNAENQAIIGNKLKEKEKQQAIFEKWSSLNELIGASDGKKYRNFAQALTFEHLIGLSNRQLQKMSDRYILKRSGDASNPFELSVIDKFQNGEERTAQNLSGGEKFIVSLSLALGLSKMASKNMQIDTMFIDEGFGTLDTDYLDVALNALANLQSEGKIIGVISHLTELKERIATHIEVVTTGNGHSKIRITG